jgi:RNA-directed DNA polymerase
MRIRHRPVREQGAWLCLVVVRWMNYHAVPGNLKRVSQFRTTAMRLWLDTRARIAGSCLESLRRRSQRHRLTRERVGPFVNKVLPVARVVHAYPNGRFYAKHPE